MKSVYPLVLCAALLSACAVSPELDSHFGDAVATVRQRQTLNPQGSPAPALGMDGKAAKETMDRYLDSYKSPPPTINVINIGGGLGK